MLGASQLLVTKLTAGMRTRASNVGHASCKCIIATLLSLILLTAAAI